MVDDCKEIIEQCINLSYGQEEGSLFVILTKKPNVPVYKKANRKLFKEKGRKLSVLDKQDQVVIKKLASLDGAIIINSKGEMEELGATLIYSSRLIGHGKRHAFASGTSKKVEGCVCILTSEEDKKIRTFKFGMPMTEMDMEKKIPVSTRHKIAELLTDRTTGTIIAGGIAASILTLNPIPALVTITGTQTIVYVGIDRIKRIFGIKKR